MVMTPEDNTLAPVAQAGDDKVGSEGDPEDFRLKRSPRNPQKKHIHKAMHGNMQALKQKHVPRPVHSKYKHSSTAKNSISLFMLDA